MMPGAGPRGDRAKKRGTAWLAGAGLWIAMGAAVAGPPGLAGWARVTFACCMGLTALSFIAVYRGRGRRPGSGLGVHGWDDDRGPAGGAAHERPTLRLVSLLMPASAGRRWLAEAESLLAEITATRRGAAVRSYLRSAPRLTAMMWAREIFRPRRPGQRRPG